MTVLSVPFVTQAALDAFHEYKKDTKPQYQAIQASMTGLHATLTASAKSNQRPLFRPAPGYTLLDIAEDWKVRAFGVAYSTVALGFHLSCSCLFGSKDVGDHSVLIHSDL
jgi:hypothetical protein